MTSETTTDDIEQSEPDECGFCGGRLFNVFEDDEGNIVAIRCAACEEVFST